MWEDGCLLVQSKAHVNKHPPCLRRFCYDRLSSLMKTLEITNTDEFLAIQLVADFGTLLGTYSRGFAVIIEPYDERLPHIPDPVLQLRSDLV